MSKAQSNIIITLCCFYFVALAMDVSAREVETYDPWNAWRESLKKELLHRAQLPDVRANDVGFYSIRGRFWFDQKGIVHDLRFEVEPKTASPEKCLIYKTKFKKALLSCQPLPQMDPSIIRKKSCANFTYVPFPVKTVNPDPVFRVSRQSCWNGDI